jgi:Family of unknown function (DUF6510)
MQIEEMRLDGNAAAGLLREIFSQEMTVAAATCTGCGVEHEIGSLLEYGHAMGVVLRCPECDGAMLRIARTPGWLRLDASGISYLRVPDRVAPV